MERCTQFLRRYGYVLKADVAQFFPSVDHAVLRDILARPIRDERVLRLIDLILVSGSGVLDTEYSPHWHRADFDAETGQGDLFAIVRPRGLPIGNLTSQFWANVLLNELDHFVKRELKCKAYIRYVDDFVLFHDDKAQLQRWKADIARYLDKLRLTLHPRKSVVFPSRVGVEFLGFHHFRTHRWLRRGNARRFTRKLRRLAAAYGRGEIELETMHRSVQGWTAHAAHGDTWRLRKHILAAVPIPPRQVAP